MSNEIKLVIEANGKFHEAKQPDRKTAFAEALKIRKFPYAANASVYVGKTMVDWVSHCPFNEKGAKWRM